MNDMIIKVQPARPALVQAPYVEAVYIREVYVLGIRMPLKEIR